jgi:uncharacterized protein with PQ loop repeat
MRVAPVEILGWVSSFILVLTLVKQVAKQWKTGHSEGVSRWLFIGQVAASVGFLVYSLLIENWVFVVTNGLLVLNSLVGLFIVLWQKRHPGTAPKVAIR